MPFRIKPTFFALLLTMPFITNNALAETIAKVNVSVISTDLFMASF
jgi:hypothetical protein